MHSAQELPANGLSIPVYFACVLAVTVATTAIAAWTRPSFRTELALLSGLQTLTVAAPYSFYSMRVAPILDAHCAGCHGATRAKGKLRLDSFGHLSLGGRNGHIVASDNVQASELWTRVNLPPDDPKAMPPSGKAALSEDELTVLRLWIEKGASPSLPATAVKDAPPLPKRIVFENFDPARVAAERAPMAKTLETLQQHLPGVISYVSRGSADLQINASLMGSRFGDAEMAMLRPLESRISSLDASRTGITDASAARLAAMRRLRDLRLNDTIVGSTTAKALSGHPSLQSLAMSGTNISQGDLRQLREKGVKVYASTP